MPIVGGTYNASDWSHSTVFTVSLDSIAFENAPTLTTRWTPPLGFRNQWMLADSKEEIFTTFTSIMPALGTPTI
jgi:hypothetical protein